MASIGYLFGDNALSTLAGTLSSSSTSATLALGTGAKFPSPQSGQYFAASLTDAATKTDSEIVLVTNVTGDVLTIVRGQEGTSPRAWVVGDFLWNGPTAGQMGAMAQSSHFALPQAARAQSVSIGPSYSGTLSLSMVAPSDGYANTMGYLNFGAQSGGAITASLTNSTGGSASADISSLPQTQAQVTGVSAGTTFTAYFTITSSAGSYAAQQTSYGLVLTFTPTD